MFHCLMKCLGISYFIFTFNLIQYIIFRILMLLAVARQNRNHLRALLNAIVDNYGNQSVVVIFVRKRASAASVAGQPQIFMIQPRIQNILGEHKICKFLSACLNRLHAKNM